MINQDPPLLFEMLKSFTTLARNLNLSETVRILNSTRQTVRRHISQLEQIRGAKLFELNNRQYCLTDTGRRSLREAENLIARGHAWLANDMGHLGGLLHLTAQPTDDHQYFLQQHPLGALWRDGTELLQFGFRCWAAATGDIESEQFRAIRPYLMIFRRLDSDWICVDVGAKSSYATWYGWRWERSSVGRGIADLPGGPGFIHLLTQPFMEIQKTEAVRFDHIHTSIGRDESEKQVPISYQRLMMGCRFADGSPAIAALVDRTYAIDIQGVSDERVRTMPKDLLMHFCPEISES